MTRWLAGGEVGPYVLLEEIGAGGMGEVWKARDTRLGRIVAIKHLHGVSTGFEHEARAIASLNHPNICTLYDVGPDFLIMEFIDGVPLTGPLDAATTLALARQVASALEAAHAKGIVHADLKPANILVAEGRVKLVDFGIAKLLDTSDEATLTVDNVVVGTPSYMAPEQAQGGKPDARSDIFSFGAVLYEMVSGRRAFDGTSTADRLAAVLRDEPRPLAAPDSLVRFVGRCLEKSPARRFQTIAELMRALAEVESPPAADSSSIAVLPFANMSSDSEQEYFSDGLTEEIINALAHVPRLKVIARTSAFAFKGQNIDIRRIAATLGVKHVLEGSVRKGGSRIRVTAQLIDVDDGCHVWSERYDRDMADIFAVQDDIASAIARQLRKTLRVDEPIHRAYTPSVAAYEAYLLGKHRQWTLAPQAREQARRCYEEAAALDPAFALPWVGLAEHYHIAASGKGTAARDAALRVRETAERALALDPASAEAQVWLGVQASTYAHDWTTGARLFRMAAASGTVTPRVRHMLAYFYLRFIGLAPQAVDDHRQVLDSDPLNLIYRVGLVMSLISAGRSAEAAEESRRLMEIAPEFPAAYTLLAFDFGTATPAAVLDVAERGYALASWSPGMIGLLAGILSLTGNGERVASLLNEMGDPDVYGNAVDFALFHLARGESDRAVDYALALARQQHPLLMMTILGGPYASTLRSSGRWPSVAAAVGLPA